MKNPQIIPKTNPFINEYNWKRINLPSEETIIKKFAKNNVTIALEFFYAKKEKLYPVSISKCNSHRERQVIILMVSNGEKIEGKSDGQWYYVFKRNYINKNDGFYCLNSLHSSRTKKTFNVIKEYIKRKISNEIMSSENIKML